LDAQPRSAAPQLGRRIRVLSTKYDGSLHNDYEALLIDEESSTSPDDECLRLYVAQGTPLHSYRGDGPIGVGFTALFWPGADRWFNVYHNHWPTQRHAIETYVNVSLPAEFDGETIRWVDMDLDVVVRTGHRIELWDEDEFAEHLEQFRYPDNVVARARAAAGELMRAAAAGEPPFDRASHIWVQKPVDA
jgi:protein associated with RNAse G/E